jgi:hypothetical protein
MPHGSRKRGSRMSAIPERSLGARQSWARHSGIGGLAVRRFARHAVTRKAAALWGALGQTGAGEHLGGPLMDVVVADASAPGRETSRWLLAGVPSPVSLRDLIRFRVREEVAAYNANPEPRFNGLVQPVGAEVALNGYELQKPRRLDWERQAETALDAFRRNGFFVFVGDRQVDDVDEELTLAEADVVSFVRLVPLVGG